MTNAEDPAIDEARAKDAQSPLERLMAGHEIDPDTLTDEQLASCFPAFSAVWMRVMDSLMAREQLNIDIQDD